MDLSELRFVCKTDQLELAAKRIQELTAAIEALSAKEKSASTIAKETAATERQKIKDAEKLEQLKRKLAEAEAKAQAAANGTAGANDKAASKAASLASLLDRLNNTYLELAKGQTRGEASTLQLARTLGASVDQINQVRASLQNIAGLTSNPFDASRGSLIRIQSELDGIRERARLAGESIYLSGTQLAEYAKISNQVKGQVTGLGLDPLQGAGLALYTTELEKQRKEYVRIAEEVNRKTAAEKVHNDTLKAQATIMAELEQKNKNIQESINRNNAVTSGMQGGMSQANAGTQYDNAKSMQGATPEQLVRIQERITLTQKLTESEKLLNTEIKTQDDLLKHIEGLVAQRKAIDDLNKGIIENIAERKKMDDLMQKYTALGLNNTNAREASQLEMKGASQASIDSLKTYLLGIQASNKALEDQRRIAEEVDRANLKMAQSAAAARYSAAGNSSSISNQAGSMEAKGVNQSVINAYIQEASAKENAAKATRELAAANKYITDTEEKLAAAVSGANQNLNRQSTDELVKYQKALQTVGTSAADATRKLELFKAQQSAIAEKEREKQLNHLSRGISTQMGDVGISLASGMNPLTVALQQGDQIRYLLQQAGADGKELQKAMNGAATQIASSVALVFKAVSGFVTGVFITAYESIKTAAKGVWQFGKDVKDVFGMAFDSSLSLTDKIDLLKQSYEMLSKSLVNIRNIAIGLSAVLIGGLAIGLYKVIQEEQELAKQLALTGGSLGVSQASALAYAESMNSVGISTGRATEVITEMAKQGGFFANEITMVTKSAVDMKMYAGVAIEDTVKEFAKLRKDPVKGMEELAIATGMIAPEVVRAVIELKEQGKTADAVALAMSTLASVEKQQVAQMKEDFTGFAIFMKGIGRDISDAFSSMFKGMWTKTPVNEALRETRSKLLEQVSEMENTQAGNKGVLDFFGVKTDTSKLEELKGKIASITKSIRNSELKDSNETQDKTNKSQSAELIAQARDLELRYAKQSYKIDLERLGVTEKIKKAEGLGQTETANSLKNTLKLLDVRHKDALDSEAKKDKGPKAATSSFSGVASEVSLVDNSSNIQRQYQSELSKTEKFVNDQRSILKLSYEAGVVAKGEYIAKDLGLIQDGQSKELRVIQKYAALIEAENTRMQEQVEKRRADALGATGDPASRTKINRTADDEITKLTESLKTFKELQQDKSDVIASESTRRYYESLKEQNQVMIEAKKHLEELNKATRDAAEARRMDAEFQLQALVTSGSELVMLKAKNDTMQGYIKIKDKLQQDLGKAEKEHSDFTSNTTFDGSNQEAIEKSFQQWQNIELLKQQLTQAGIDAELASRNAATDAFNKYYMDKAMEVRDGTANAITEGIMNGGKAGSDAIKNVLNNVLKDLLNNVFKAALGSIGTEITRAISGGQQQQSSGGGLFQSLIGAGLSALGGGISGGFGATASAAPSQYALSSGTDMTSGFKFRATGGFVNQGSEYIVGENGPEKFTPKQAGSITPNHKLTNQSASSDPMKVTIINNTSAPIGKVTERQISPTERALVIEEAVQAVASAMHDPNHKVSKSLGQNYKMQRNR